MTTLFHTVNNEQGLCSHIFSYAMIRCVMLYWTSVIKNGIVLACHMFFLSFLTIFYPGHPLSMFREEQVKNKKSRTLSIRNIDSKQLCASMTMVALMFISFL